MKCCYVWVLCGLILRMRIRCVEAASVHLHATNSSAAPAAATHKLKQLVSHVDDSTNRKHYHRHGLTHSNVTSSDSCGVLEGGVVRPFKILMAFGESYFPVFLNWLLFYRRSCSDLSHLYTLCFDHKTDVLLSRLGLNCSFVHPISTASPSQVWPARNLEVKKILQAGFDVFESDADALWLKNPFPLIAKHPESVFIASRGSHPPEISKKYGAAICMGFVYIKTCDFTKHMWEHLLPKIEANPSNGDQKPVNTYFEAHHPLQYDRKLTYVDSKTPDTGTFQFNNHALKLTLLAHHDVVRICDSDEVVRNAVVTHCLSAKNGEDKHVVASKFHLWQLSSDWEKTLPSLFNISSSQ